MTRGSGSGLGATAAAAQPSGEPTAPSPGWSSASATTTTPSAARRTGARNPAVARKTRPPGAAQRRRRRDAGAHHSQGNGYALPSGYRRFLQPHPLQIQQAPSTGAPPHRPQQLLHPVLGRGTATAALQRPHFRVALPSRRCLISHPGGGLPTRQQAPGGRGQQHVGRQHHRRHLHPLQAVKRLHRFRDAASSSGSEESGSCPNRGGTEGGQLAILCFRGSSHTTAAEEQANTCRRRRDEQQGQSTYADDHSGYFGFISGGA
jgi:hypothetical protein